MEYFQIPGTVFWDHGISLQARFLYAVIFKYARNGKAEFCWASNRHLAERFQVSQKTIQNCVAELKVRGYVEVEHCKGKTRKLYPLWDLCDVAVSEVSQ